MESMKDMKRGTKHSMMWFYLHALHVLHGKKKIHQQAPVFPACDSYVYQGEKDMKGGTKQMNDVVLPSCSSCASW